MALAEVHLGRDGILFAAQTFDDDLGFWIPVLRTLSWKLSIASLPIRDMRMEVASIFY